MTFPPAISKGQGLDRGTQLLRQLRLVPVVNSTLLKVSSQICHSNKTRPNAAFTIFLFLFAGAASSASDGSNNAGPYNIVGQRHVSFEMAGAVLNQYRHTSLPSDIRIALVLSEPERAPAKFLRWKSTIDSTVEEVIVDSKSPTDIWLEKSLKAAFPSLEVTGSLSKSHGYDLVFRSGLEASITTTTENSLEIYRGYEVTIVLTAEDKDGQRLDRFAGTGSADFGKSMYWSPKTRMKSVGPSAVQKAASQLLNALERSDNLSIYLRELQEAKERPANLVASVEFNDDSSFFPDKRLDAGENADIIIKIKNHGPGIAFDAKIVLTTQNNNILISPEVRVGNLNPGEERTTAARISGDLALSSGIGRIIAQSIEKRGYGGRSISLEFATESLARPNFRIIDIAFNDKYGRAAGDGDGLPANGELVEAIVRITNAGPGDAPGGRLKTTSLDTSINILDPEIILPPIAAHTIAEARVLIKLPVEVKNQKLPLLFEATEIRGASVAIAKREETWNLQIKKPFLKIDYRLYDGNSPASFGNRDGVANNGEKLELTLRLLNKGDLAAQGIFLQIAALDSSVVLETTEIRLKDLPSGGEGEEKRLVLSLPRTFGANQSTDSISLMARLTQQHFPAVEQKLLLPFRHQRPELSLQFSNPPALMEGGTAIVSLQAVNSGSSSAQDVQIEVASETSGVKLLDERDVLRESLRFNLGEIPVSGSSQRILVKVFAQRGLGIAQGRLRAVVKQADFLPSEKGVFLVIEKEAALVVPPANTPGMESRGLGSVSASAPATISFLRYDSGERLSQEAIVLRFEVQAARELQEVRLQHNGRGVALEKVVDYRNSDDKTLVSRHEVPISLMAGENIFEVIALTVEGQRSTRTLSLFRHQEEGKIWVAAIGISKYADPSIPDLSFADRDAEAFYDYYRNVIGLPKEQLFLLTDEQATLKSIKSVLGTQLQFRASNPEDTVIVYFAGHGQKEADVASPDSDGFNKYLLPHDASPSDLFSTAIAMDEIAGILRRLRPHRIVFILDSCFSGGAGGRSLFDPHLSTRSTIDGKFLERVADAGKGRVLLTASGPNELAQERPDLGHGIFTYYLLLALKGQADENRDGLVDVDEAYRFTWSQVVEATKDRQHPVRRAPNSQGTVVLGRSLSH